MSQASLNSQAYNGPVLSAEARRAQQWRNSWARAFHDEAERTGLCLTPPVYDAAVHQRDVLAAEPRDAVWSILGALPHD